MRNDDKKQFLLLTSSTFLDLEVNSYSRQKIVERDRVAVFEENSVVRNLLLGRRHVSFFLNFLLQPLDRIAELDVDRQRLSVQLPFRFVSNIRHLNLDRDGALKSEKDGLTMTLMIYTRIVYLVAAHEHILGNEIVLLSCLLVRRFIFRNFHDWRSWSEWRHTRHSRKSDGETRWS